MRAKDFLIPLLFIVTAIIGIFVLISVSEGGLSDEAKELVDDLWWKHYGSPITGSVISYDPLSHWSWTVNFDNGILTVKTSDGTWFIEMQRKEE